MMSFSGLTRESRPTTPPLDSSLRWNDKLITTKHPHNQEGERVMGHFRYRVEIGSGHGRAFQSLDALVDTGATYTWVPRPLLERLGIVPAFKREFLLADGKRVRYDVAQVLARIDGQSLYTLCIFSDEGSEPLLGVVTLEEFGLGVDPVNRKLIPVAGYLTDVSANPG
jgi:aspartyl protease family protein